MARDDKEKVVLEGQAAIDLWLQGKDAWNKWVEENPVADISFSGVDFSEFERVSFQEYKFPNGNVDFSVTEFGECEVSFTETNFGDGYVNFASAKFSGDRVYFPRIKIGKGRVNFSRTMFGNGHVSFRFANFGDGNVFFDGASFGEGHVTFANAKFGEGDVSFFMTSFSCRVLDFYNLKFTKGYVDFSHAKFTRGAITFESADFGTGNVFFDLSLFGKVNVSFEQAKIDGAFRFSNIKNVNKIKSISFKYVTFDGAISMDGNHFNCVPDFTNTKLSHQLSLSHFSVKAKEKKPFKFLQKFFLQYQKTLWGSKIKFTSAKKAIYWAKSFSWLGKTSASDRYDIDRLRRLKELAETNKHHQLALDLHIEEMKCSRWIETPWQKLPVEFLFDKCGDYGRSIFRPIISLVLLWLSFAPIYALASSKKDVLSDALLFSFSQMFSLIPSSKDARTESSKELYGVVVDDKLIVDIPNYVFGLAGLQSIASIALIFLVGLALRNRFRI